jgi:hypothetical protein
MVVMANCNLEGTLPMVIVCTDNVIASYRMWTAQCSTLQLEHVLLDVGSNQLAPCTYFIAGRVMEVWHLCGSRAQIL